MDTMVDRPSEKILKDRMQARIDMAAAHRLAVMHDFHEGIDNHFTLLVPGRSDRFYLNNFGLHWSEVTASNLIEVALDGEIVDGEGIADRSAICIHAPIHQLIPSAACVLHTHMPYCTALAQLQDMTLEMTGQAALQFANKIAYDENYGGLADLRSEGERMAGLMDGKPILMLANHGVVVTGKTVAQAYHRLYFLERACRTQMFSMWTGQPRRFVTKDMIEKVTEQAKMTDPNMQMSSAEYHFTALKRILDRTQPDYAD
jgi:ribulose-5-phosphate 4-epimerase/fuculose-1-phosphate aldolase